MISRNAEPTAPGDCDRCGEPLPPRVGSGRPRKRHASCSGPRHDAQGRLRKQPTDAVGVTITDAIEAGAISRFGSIGRRGVLAARAGMDLLLFSNKDVGEGDQGLSALTAALRSHSLNLTTFRAAVGRILALRRDLASGRPLPSP